MIQGLGTSKSEEGKEYFKDIDKHKKEFVWADEQDGNAIELAFSKKKIEARKNWLRQFEVSFMITANHSQLIFQLYSEKHILSNYFSRTIILIKSRSLSNTVISSTRS